MNRSIIRFVGCVSLVGVLLSWSAVAQNKKLAQTGMKFLNVGMGARQSAMAEAFTSMTGNSTSMFYNTAGMAGIGTFADASFGYVQWIADIKHLYGALAVKPFDGDYGVLGFTIQSVDYGDIEATVRANNSQGYLDMGTFTPTAMMFGIGYAKALSDKFSVGGNVKFVYQNLGDGITGAVFVRNVLNEDSTVSQVTKIKNSLSVPAFDFGMLYRTGYKSLTLGVSIRNFAREVAYVQESFQLPLTFKIGVSMNVFDFFDQQDGMHSLMLAVDAEHPRDYPEQIRFGAEYVFEQTVAVRAGFVSPADEYSFTYGLGLQHSFEGTSFGLDYAYTPFGVFSSVSRLSLRVGF